MASRRKQSVPTKRKLDGNPSVEDAIRPDSLTPSSGDDEIILDLSKKRLAAPLQQSAPTATPLAALTHLTGPPHRRTDVAATLDCLTSLSSLVQMVGNTPARNPNFTPTRPHRSTEDLPAEWWTFVKREQTAEVRRATEAKQIFTCLQCHTAFQSMDELVKHMEVSKHFANVPKHYSWSVQYAKQKIRQMKIKMKYSDRMLYFCEFCQKPFSESVLTHFGELHNMHDAVENMNFVHVITMTDPHNSTPSQSPTTSVAPASHHPKDSASAQLNGGTAAPQWDKTAKRRKNSDDQEATRSSQQRRSSQLQPLVEKRRPK